MKNLPADLRPREKLLTRGPAALADAELLALLLRTGLPGQGVLQMAQSLLDRFGGLTGLLAAEPSALEKVKGLGPAKRAELAAVLEIARRTLSARLSEAPVFDSPQTVKDFLQLQIGSKQHEVFAVVFLDARHRLLAFEELFQGTLNHASVHPREVVKRALALNAAAAVLAHNHPLCGKGYCQQRWIVNLDDGPYAVKDRWRRENSAFRSIYGRTVSGLRRNRSAEGQPVAPHAEST